MCIAEFAFLYYACQGPQLTQEARLRKQSPRLKHHRRMMLSFATAPVHSLDSDCGGVCFTSCTPTARSRAYRFADAARCAASDFGVSTRYGPISHPKWIARSQEVQNEAD